SQTCRPAPSWTTKAFVGTRDDRAAAQDARAVREVSPRHSPWHLRRTVDQQRTGEPCAVKIARTVRWGVVGKVPQKNCGNSLAAYPTSWTATEISKIPPTPRVPACS